MTPLFIGIAGGTGSGKSTIAHKLATALPTESVVTIDHDAYYRDRSDLAIADRQQLNYDHPDALETELLVRNAGKLRAGEPVELPVYDFKTHARSPSTRRVTPAPVVIVEGILVFVDPGLRAALDIKIFVDTDADIRVFRRIRRDLEQRGRVDDILPKLKEKKKEARQAELARGKERTNLSKNLSPIDVHFAKQNASDLGWRADAESGNSNSKESARAATAQESQGDKRVADWISEQEKIEEEKRGQAELGKIAEKPDARTSKLKAKAELERAA